MTGTQCQGVKPTPGAQGFAHKTALPAQMTVAIATLGCKANQYDSVAVSELLEARGMKVVEFPSMADAYVINTCTVTARSDSESARTARRARRLNPDATIVLTGCFAQAWPDEAGRLLGVDHVVGNSEKGLIADLLLSGRLSEKIGAIETASRMDGVRGASASDLRARRFTARTRASLKVQDGCDMECTYCIIPRARGRSTSLAIREVEAEMDALIEAGFKEIVLTAIHLGAYGADLPDKPGLIDILRSFEERANGCRLRLGSLDPNELGDDVIETLSSSKKICNHVHLSLQSGDDRILRLMRRNYDVALFAQRVEKLARAVDNVSIGVDVIAGFPGETQAEFEKTAAVIGTLPISYMHVFPYSARRSTPAASFKGRVGREETRARCERLRALDVEKRRTFCEKAIGRTVDVLFEADDKGSARRGLSSNYIEIGVRGAVIPRNETRLVRLTGVTDYGMEGFLC